MTIIDQHALHERILYEQLRRRIDGRAMETQNLLVPEPVDLSPAEAAAALENRALLAQLGMKVEPFGGDTVLITSFPAMLANMNPVEVLRGLVERLLGGGKQPDRRDLLDELLHTIACKAADQGGRPADARGDRGAVGAAAPGRRRPPLSARPADGAGLHAGGVGQAVQADLRPALETSHRTGSGSDTAAPAVMIVSPHLRE